MLSDICYSEPMTDSEIFESIMKAVQQELKQAYSRKQTGLKRKAQNRDSLIRVTAQSIVGKATSPFCIILLIIKNCTRTNIISCVNEHVGSSKQITVK